MNAPLSPEFQQYFDTADDDRKARLFVLHNLIVSLYSNAEMVISYGIPMYKLPTGRIGIGYWKGGVSLYTTENNFVDFREKHPHLKTSKGTINFKTADAIPEADLKEVIKRAMEAKA